MLEIRLFLSYVFDWVIVLALLVVTILIFPEHSFQHHQPFSLNNYSLQYPHKSDTIPYGFLAIICIAAPIGIFFFWGIFIEGWTSLIRRSKEAEGQAVEDDTGPKPVEKSRGLVYFDLSIQERLKNLHLTCLGFFLSLTLVVFITYLLKATVGKPRPDVISRCRPSYEALVEQYGLKSNSTSPSNGGGAGPPSWKLANVDICQGWGISGGSVVAINDQEVTDVSSFGAFLTSNRTSASNITIVHNVRWDKARGHWEEMMEEGWRSFPSLHAGIAFATYVYLSLFLAFKTGVLASAYPMFKTDGPSKRDKNIPSAKQRPAVGNLLPGETNSTESIARRRTVSAIHPPAPAVRPHTSASMGSTRAFASARPQTALDEIEEIGGVSNSAAGRGGPVHRLHPSFSTRGRRSGSQTHNGDYAGDGLAVTSPQTQEDHLGLMQEDASPPDSAPKAEILPLKICTRGVSFVFIIVVAPILAALLIVTTRIADYRSHPFDLIFGALLGTLLGIWGFRQYYPSFGATPESVARSGGHRVEWKPGQAFAYRRWGTRHYVNKKGRWDWDDEEGGVELEDIRNRHDGTVRHDERPKGRHEQPGGNEGAVVARRNDAASMPPPQRSRPIPLSPRTNANPGSSNHLRLDQQGDNARGRSSDQGHRRGFSLSFRRSLSRRRSLHNLEGKRRKSLSDLNTSIVPAEVPRIPTALLDGIVGDGALGVGGTRL